MERRRWHHGRAPWRASLPNHSTGTEAWPPDFTYDLDVALPPVPSSTRSLSYADVAANRRQGLRQNTLGTGFVSSSAEEGTVSRL
jgi:hypothetical protein